MSFFSGLGVSSRCFFRVAVIILEPLPPLPPYVCASRPETDEVLSILSVVVVGAGASTLSAPLCAVFFFRFAGSRPLHKVKFLIFSNSTEDPSSRFAICSLKVVSNIWPAVFSFFSRRWHLVFESFTPVLPSGFNRRHFRNVHPFRVALVYLFLGCFFRCPCSTDGPS
jgi:hypothetical protein